MIRIVLAPAGAGKTAAALAALGEPRRGRAALLLPGALHRHRLAGALDTIPRLNAGSFDFFARYVLRLAGPLPDLATPATRHALLREELGALAAAGRLPILGPVATKGGVVAEALRLIDELRAAGMAPAALAAAEVSPYDRELAAVYAGYGAALDAYGLEDRNGLLLRARDLLRAGAVPRLRYELLVVDGFDQLTPLQLELLGELARRADETLVTLTGGPAPRQAHGRFARTLAALRAALPEAQVEQLAAAPALSPPLAQIEAGLFESAPPPPVDAAGAVAVIRAPDREREVRAALRRARALIAAGAPAESIAIIYRSGEPYTALVREVAAEYGLPLAHFEGLRLGEAPPILTLLGLLALPRDGFPRRAVAECWRALGDPEAAGRFERATAGAGRGLPRLRAALTALAVATPPAPGDAPDPRGVAPDEAAALLARLDAFTGWLDPLPVAAPDAYLAWLRGLLGWEREAPHDAAGAGPWPSLDGLWTSAEQRTRLRLLLAEREATARLLGQGPRPYATFVAELEGALAEAAYGGAMPGPGAVAVLPMLAARGQVFDHVIMLGVSEGSLPARLPEPPFYTRRERARLAARGAAPPPADPGDERSLFYEAATRARRSLTMAYTRLDEAGNPLEASPYLRELVALFAPESVVTTTILAGSAPEPGEAASAQEALVAAAATGSLDRLPAGVPAALAAHVARAAAVERRREGGEPHGAHEGVVDHPAVTAVLARHYGPGYSWSATQINDFTTCPFRFAAAHLLRLVPRGDQDEALEGAGRGQLAHAVLARAGQAWARLDAPHDATSESQILAALASAADEVLAAAPATFGFEPGPLWEWEQAELRAGLARAVARSLRAGWEGFRPAGVEESFGKGRGLPPLRVQTPAGEALVSGRIDRVDQDAAGSLALIDYKSGSANRSLRETVEGRDVQLTVYAMAAEELGASGQRVVLAAYLTLGNGKLSPPLTPVERPAAEAALRERLAAAMSGARAGGFAVRPSDGCPPGCAFAAICRVNPAK